MTGIVLAGAFLAGVILHDSGVGWVLAPPLVSGGIMALALSSRRGDRVMVVLALVLLALGAWRAERSGGRVGQITASMTNDRVVSAIVVGLPRRETTRVAATIRLEGGNKPTVSASLPLYPTLSSGDQIRFWAPASWASSGPETVIVPASSRAEEIFIPAFEIERSSTSLGTRLRIRTDNWLTSSIERYVPEPAGALTLGILNGDDSGMTRATQEHFRLSGMSHITAVSGWNVALVAGLLSLVTRRLAPTSLITLLAGAGVVWAYAFLVGMGPSVVRAAGMATVFLAARWRGRQGDLITSMLLTVAVIVALTPDIRFDIGFQLSVAATLGIVLFVEQFDTLSAWQTALALPFVAQIAVAPLQLHHFSSYSLLSPPANLIAAPLVGAVMIGGVATVVASLIHPVLAQIAGIITWLPARLIVAIAEREAALVGASGTTIALGWTATFLTYLALVIGYCLWSARRKIARLRLRAFQLDAGI